MPTSKPTASVSIVPVSSMKSICLLSIVVSLALKRFLKGCKVYVIDLKVNRCQQAAPK